MTKARLLRKHGGKMPVTEDYHTLNRMVGWKGGCKANSKSMAKGAKKAARHMASEARWQGGTRIVMQSTANAQPASDYTSQLSPRDGTIYERSTGPTYMRKGTK